MSYIPNDFTTAAVINANTLFQNYDDELQQLMTDAGNYLETEIVKVYEETGSIVTNGIGINRVDNIANLKLQDGLVFNTIEVLGYYTKGDGGGGTFYWDSPSTESDNGGTIIQATGITTGRWKRVLNNGSVNAKLFGVKGDGIADDTNALNKCFSASDLVVIDEGMNCLCNSVTSDYIISINKNLAIYGKGKITFSTPANSNNINGLKIISGNVDISGISLYMKNNEGTSQLGVNRIIEIGNANVRIEKVIFNGMAMKFSSYNYFTYAVFFKDNSISSLYCSNCSFAGFMYGVVSALTFAGSASNIKINNNNFSIISGDCIELNATYTYGGFITNVEIVGNYCTDFTGDTSITTAGFGIGLAGCENVKVLNNYVDATYLEGCHIEDKSRFVTVDSNTFRSKRGVMLYHPLQTELISDDYGIIKIHNNTIIGILAITLGESNINSFTESSLSTASVGIFCPTQGVFTTAYYVSIENNSINGCDYGIVLPTSKSGSISNNTLTSNIVSFYSDSPHYSYGNKIVNNVITNTKKAFKGQRMIIGKNIFENTINIFEKDGAVGTLILNDGSTFISNEVTILPGAIATIPVVNAPSIMYEKDISITLSEYNDVSSSAGWASHNVYESSYNGTTLTSTSKSSYLYGAIMVDSTPFTIASGMLNAKIGNSGGSSKKIKMISSFDSNLVFEQ